MRIFHVLFCLMAAAGSAFAGYHDMFFYKSPTSDFLYSPSPDLSEAKNSKGEQKPFAPRNHVRIRVIDPPSNPESRLGFDLERPFLILDGIYLDGDGKRSLSGFQEETEQFGLPTLLKSLGYTPILVQFSETVEQTLSMNAMYFESVLRFLNDNVFFDFKNREDGFIVMGVSQGGILGRYGSYLYDISRKTTDAPIKLYASLDSPHQGAVMPMALRYTINYWATVGGSAAAEKFKDLLDGPGADGLLLYQPQGSKGTYSENTSPNRFLFNEYRKAAEYKGFPAVLLSQGQMKGIVESKSKKLFDLNRMVTKLESVFGRAVSTLNSTVFEKDTVARNRMYEAFEKSVQDTRVGNSKMDMIQGSTYPFARTLYSSLREGFVDAMPKDYELKLFSIFGKKVTVTLKSSWVKDTLYESSSTFIPVASAMDLLCNGDLAIRDNCAFTIQQGGFPFENPGARSTGDVVFAVDQTHPRYGEAKSGRHVELPGNRMDLDTNVLRGMQTDIYRMLCEVAKYDYNEKSKTFNNPNLVGYFDPGASCLDPSKIPDIVKRSGLLRFKKFGFARYDYKPEATEMESHVEFEVPAGWHKVASFDNGEKIPEGTFFEVDVDVKSCKGNWVKAELLLTRTASGFGQLQLEEQKLNVEDGKQTLRWSMPSTPGSLDKYRWFRLVINSDGASVKVSNPRLVYGTHSAQAVQKIPYATLFPKADFEVERWNMNGTFEPYADAYGSGMDITYSGVNGNIMVNMGEPYHFRGYSNLKVVFWPGTCTSTKVYFDSYMMGATSLYPAQTEGSFLAATLPLEKLINPSLSPDGGLSASKLNIRGTKSGERCLIKEISLE